MTRRVTPVDSLTVVSDESGNEIRPPGGVPDGVLPPMGGRISLVPISEYDYRAAQEQIREDDSPGVTIEGVGGRLPESRTFELKPGIGEKWFVDHVDDHYRWVIPYANAGACGVQLELRELKLPQGSAIWSVGPERRPHRMPLFKSEDHAGWWTPSTYGDFGFLLVTVPRELFGGGEPPRFELADAMEIVSLECLGEQTWVNLGRRSRIPLATRSRRRFSRDPLSVTSRSVPQGEVLDLVKNAVAACGHVRCGESGLAVRVSHSGALIRKRDQVGVENRFFLTANHAFTARKCDVNARCMEYQSFEAFWDYTATRTGSFGGYLSCEIRGNVPRSLGAKVLKVSSATDFALLDLYGLPADSLPWTFLGWSVDPPVEGANVFRVSHPLTYPQAYSAGVIAGKSELDPDYYSCCRSRAEERFLRTDLGMGVDRPGSSGAPLILRVSDAGSEQPRVVGQLWGVCKRQGEDAFYSIDGRFSETYQQIKEWIDPPLG